MNEQVTGIASKEETGSSGFGGWKNCSHCRNPEVCYSIGRCQRYDIQTVVQCKTHSGDIWNCVCINQSSTCKYRCLRSKNHRVIGILQTAPTVRVHQSPDDGTKASSGSEYSG